MDGQTNRTYRIELRPLEPYFFGGEHTLKYDGVNYAGKYQRDGGQNQRAMGYYIESLDTPSQTTLFGVLRYLGLRNPTPEYDPSAEDKRRIGGASFNISTPGGGFGWITGISPLYIMDGTGALYIKTPLDHDCGASASKYSPFADEDYMSYETSAGRRVFPKAYQEKRGVADTWMCMCCGAFADKDLFTEDESVGIAKAADTDGFFKRKSKILKKDCAFVFYATVDKDYWDSEPPLSTTVWLGQKKSAFSAKITGADEPDFQTVLLKPRIAYAQSDLYLSDDKTLDTLYEQCEFVCVKAKEHRPFETKYGKAAQSARYHRDERLIRLIGAGSVFRLADKERTETFRGIIEGDRHAAAAGFNRVQYGKDWMK